MHQHFCIRWATPPKSNNCIGPNRFCGRLSKSSSSCFWQLGRNYLGGQSKLQYVDGGEKINNENSWLWQTFRAFQQLKHDYIKAVGSLHCLRDANVFDAMCMSCWIKGADRDRVWQCIKWLTVITTLVIPAHPPFALPLTSNVMYYYKPYYPLYILLGILIFSWIIQLYKIHI